MFIDYLATMLINLVAALVLVALYLVVGINKPDQKRGCHFSASAVLILWRCL